MKFFKLWKTRRPSGGCPHSLAVWYPVPHPKYGDDRPEFAAVEAPCSMKPHDGDHVTANGKRWR